MLLNLKFVKCNYPYNGNGCLERRFKRLAQRFPEVHSEVGQVFDHDRVIFVCHVSDDLQLFFRQAEPGRIVGIGVDHGCDVAFGEILFQYVPEFFAPGIRTRRTIRIYSP